MIRQGSKSRFSRLNGQKRTCVDLELHTWLLLHLPILGFVSTSSKVVVLSSLVADPDCQSGTTSMAVIIWDLKGL